MTLLGNYSPYNVLFEKPVDYSILPVFGCLAYAALLQTHTTKFDPRASPCIFMGYSAV